MTVSPSHPVSPQPSRLVSPRPPLGGGGLRQTMRQTQQRQAPWSLGSSAVARMMRESRKIRFADIVVTRCVDALRLLGSRAGVLSCTQELSGLTFRSHLIDAAGWWLVERLDDSAHPLVWARRPVAAFMLDQRPGGKLELVPVLSDGQPRFLREAVVGRDGSDYLTRADAFHVCSCDVSPTSVLDPMFCSYCAGRTYG